MALGGMLAFLNNSFISFPKVHIFSSQEEDVDAPISWGHVCSTPYFC